MNEIENNSKGRFKRIFVDHWVKITYSILIKRVYITFLFLMGRLKPLFIVINGKTGFHNIIQIAQIAPIRLGDLGLDLLSLQCFLPATLNCYFSTHGHTLNTV